jgi:hypothetical protein
MFNEFDPLAAKQALNTEVAINAMKRELQNILDSYVGWFDPFCELTQNALDSLEERIADTSQSFRPELRVLVDIRENVLTVSDNGTGLTKDKYQQFLAPSFSFKSGNTRGHKGVGATYLAYGFNYIQIATKTPDFEAVGKMTDARKWLTDENPAGNPKVFPDSSGTCDAKFREFDRGVSVTLRLDPSTRPGNLSWLMATTANQWMTILRLKTGIGAIFPDERITVTLEVVDGKGILTTAAQQGVQYLWPHEIVRHSRSLRDLEEAQKRLFDRYGAGFRMPAAMSNLDAIFDTLTVDDLNKQIPVDDGEKAICERYDPTVYFCYTYSAKVWPQFNEALEIRQGQSVLAPGIQIAANNMPQGEIIQVPLRRNIGRQNQVHVVVHLRNCRADLGRKGFQKEIVEFSQSVARKLIDRPIQRLRSNLRPVTGARSDLARQSEVDDWKDEFAKHEGDHPLIITNENFFIPTRRVSLTSFPTREQDVIALFNQLLAGGVMRGIQIMATNERFTYDGMYRVVFDDPIENHIFDVEKNPLGVLEDYAREVGVFRSKPKIMEYKYSLDALIEDLLSGVKNSNDIDLVVVWETGSDYEGDYHITSLLDPDNLSERQYHGVTHVMTNVNTGQREMDLIVLQELVEFLNDPAGTIGRQKRKYEKDLLSEDERFGENR